MVGQRRVDVPGDRVPVDVEADERPVQVVDDSVVVGCCHARR